MTTTRLELGERTDRAKWLIRFMLTLAPRISEVAEARMGDIKKIQHRSRMIWCRTVMGKGNKEAILSLPDMLIADLAEYRLSQDLLPYPDPADNLPLVHNITAKNGRTKRDNRYCTTNGLYRELKRIFDAAAGLAEKNDAMDTARALRAATPHTLRHTSLRQLADKKNDMRLVQLLGRHDNINVSGGYVAPDIDHLLSVM